MISSADMDVVVVEVSITYSLTTWVRDGCGGLWLRSTDGVVGNLTFFVVVSG